MPRPALSIHRSYLNIWGAFAFAVALLISLQACVSVNIGSKSAQRAGGIRNEPPGSPYKMMNQTQADGAWQNKDNGNTISYLSSCNDPADPSIEGVTNELFAGIEDLKKIRSETVSYNGREALDSEIEGKIDGVLTRIRSMVFKKNDCIYTLTYIGVPASFEQDRNRFDAFLRSFAAP